MHRVTITEPFYLAECQVTNAQYELFDPAHRELRGKLGFSRDDDEAVVFVSWHDAVAYCRWLSEREGAEFRLPTEAEWEYACRAGSSTPFSSGDELAPGGARNQRRTWFPDRWRTTGDNVVPLHVGRTPPNPWGLCDMHGNVEEWCLDWYGPYLERDASDPTGPPAGDFRVARGGSHSTEAYYLRSANRAAALPEERNWLIGIRVVCADYPVPSRPARKAPLERHGTNVLQTTAPETSGRDEAPFFRGPIRYVHVPPRSYGPLFSTHNHDPAICQCPNGDLLAIWYTCVEEPGRELGILASRLRAGSASWEPASVFWDAPDRNDHAPALLCDGGRIYHFNGMSAAATWGPLRTILRTSDDSGATWSPARFINAEHGPRQMPIAAAFTLRDGTLVLPCDAVSIGDGGTALWMSADGGETWRDAGGTIAGIHASAVELQDGRLLAFGRGDEVDGTLAMSVSADRGKTWEYSASPFPPIGGSQRLVLKRRARNLPRRHGSDSAGLLRQRAGRRRRRLYGRGRRRPQGSIRHVLRAVIRRWRDLAVSPPGQRRRPRPRHRSAGWNPVHHGPQPRRGERLSHRLPVRRRPHPAHHQQQPLLLQPALARAVVIGGAPETAAPE